MRVVFRADASVEIGTGHFMRCLTLADGLKQRGAQIRFVSRDLPVHLRNMLTVKGMELALLPSLEGIASRSAHDLSHACWLPATQEQDAQATIQALTGLSWDWLVVDHYALDMRWESDLRATVKRIMVIDDLADRAHDCDLLLDQNLQEPGRYKNIVPESCQMLIGPKYALLRPQFLVARQNLRQRDGSVSHLLVFLGGADSGGETLKALSAIQMLGRADLNVDVVIGAANPHRETVESVCRSIPNMTLYRQVSDMSTRMVTADFFVGAGGTSSWERCCLGLPGVVMATAANQVEQCAALGRAGAQLYLGPENTVTPERLARLIEEMLHCPELLIHMADQGRNLVDGLGTDRIVSHLLATELLLRRAESADSAMVFLWRNHPNTRRYAFDLREIASETHERWFASVLADPDRELLIGEHENHPIGVLRYDIAPERVLVSIYLAPNLTGQGWGRQLLLAGERWLREVYPSVQVCEAEIRADNEVSLAVFKAVGYQPGRVVCRKELR